ncbi:MAG: ABC transporter substrate-binding protein [Dehalococcoidia bacterium]
MTKTGFVSAALASVLMLAGCASDATTDTDPEEDATTEEPETDDEPADDDGSATGDDSSGDVDTDEGAAAGDWEPGDAWDAGAPEEWAEVLQACQEDEGTVVVAGFPFLADAMAEGFEADTGVALEWLGGDGSANSARFEQEARADNLTIDILLGGGRELQTLLPEGLLEPVKPQMILPSVQDGPWWRDGTRHWYDTEQQYLFQGAGWVFGYVTVNADEIDPDSITVWDDLLKPEFEGQIIAYDPSTNGPGQGATGFMGARRGSDYLEELYIGQDVEFVQDNDQLIEAVARGTNPIGLYVIQSSIERFKEDFNLEVILPTDDPGYITSGFSVLKQATGAPHPNCAQVYINWYASPSGQTIYQNVMSAASNRVDIDKSGLPEYVIPQEGVEYFDDNTEEFYTGERQEYIEEVTELLGGR